MVSAPSDPRFGPIIRFGTPPISHGNIEGCVAALTGDLSSSGCGAKSLLAGFCTIEACRTCADPDSYTACGRAAIADGGPCKTLWDERRSCLTSLDPGIGATCFGSSNAIDTLRMLGVLFCGAGVGDAGVGDAGTDGASADARSDAAVDDGG